MKEAWEIDDGEREQGKRYKDDDRGGEVKEGVVKVVYLKRKGLGGFSGRNI